MRIFKPEKLSVQFIKPTTCTAPIVPRRYTLTHSDYSGQLFLTIGENYDWKQVTTIRDEVLAEWQQNKFHYCFCVYVHIDEGQFDEQIAAKRNEIFVRELPLALSAIKYGDRLLFKVYPYLAQAPVIIHFASSYAPFSRKENWGSLQQITTT